MSALGGMGVHGMSFAGPDILPTANPAGTEVWLEESNEVGQTPTNWVSHPTGIGYRRSSPGITTGGGSGSGSPSAPIPGNSPSMDTGLSDGGTTTELNRLAVNYISGGNENPTAMQPGPIGRAEQVGDGGPLRANLGNEMNVGGYVGYGLLQEWGLIQQQSDRSGGPQNHIDSSRSGTVAMAARNYGNAGDGTSAAMGPGAQGSNEQAPDQGWISWAAGVAMAPLRKADQWAGAGASFLLTGSANTGEYGSFVGMFTQYQLGGAQGALNSLNGVGDAGVGLINAGAKGVNWVAQRRVVSDDNESLDWARNKIVYESDLTHNVSKFAGGNGIITLVTAGAGAGVAPAASGGRALPLLSAILADGPLVPVLASTGSSTIPATATVISTLAGAEGQIVQMSVPGGAPPGGTPGGGGAANSAFGHSLSDLSKAGSAPDRGGLTVAGRSLTKHGAGARTGNSLFPSPKGNPAQINAQAQAIVDDIVNNPATTFSKGFRGRFGETIEAVAPDGRGIVYDINGKFLFFKE
jgi:hypothetical protein